MCDLSTEYAWHQQLQLMQTQLICNQYWQTEWSKDWMQDKLPRISAS